MLIKCSICGIEKTKDHFSPQEKRCKPCNSKRVYNRTKNNPTFQSFRAAKERCINKRHKNYLEYGGRGIKFEFASWQELEAHIGPRPPNYTLDRINTNGHYTKGNVRWATRKEQGENTRKFKCTPEFIKYVKRLVESNIPQRIIALLTGVHVNTIQKAKNAQQI